ncbi:hypothetical protein [Bdellovibrio bacteriovorus]|uniref:hypothetical protein n=1 Tax=Bdellovibrio bacteriovorus TaxID=959 RepID=UPI003D052D11
MEFLTDFFVKALSVTTMLSLGLGSNGQSLAGLNWRSLRAPLFISFAALPALTFALLWLLGERNDQVVLGLTIAAASAGGSSAGIFVKAAKGSEGLSGALVIVQAVISSLSLPLALGGVFSSTSYWQARGPNGCQRSIP